jgi:hypothetical protein
MSSEEFMIVLSMGISEYTQERLCELAYGRGATGQASATKLWGAYMLLCGECGVDIGKLPVEQLLVFVDARRKRFHRLFLEAMAAYQAKPSG